MTRCLTGRGGPHQVCCYCEEVEKSGKTVCRDCVSRTVCHQLKSLLSAYREVVAFIFRFACFFQISSAAVG